VLKADWISDFDETWRARCGRAEFDAVLRDLLNVSNAERRVLRDCVPDRSWRPVGHRVKDALDEPPTDSTHRAGSC
jgi:hypothetical protein